MNTAVHLGKAENLDTGCPGRTQQRGVRDILIGVRIRLSMGPDEESCRPDFAVALYLGHASPERRIELGETPMRRLKARLNAASDW
jgi:hypothetical protein